MRIETLKKKLEPPVDMYNQAYPYFMYQRYKLVAGETRKIFNTKVVDGYFYLLSNIVAKSPITNIIGSNLSNKFSINIKSVDRNRAFNNEPVKLELITSTTEDTKVFAAPSPVDADGFNVNLTATGLKNCVNLNQVYLFSSAIFFEIISDKPLAGDTYLDFLLRGYYVPINIAMPL